MNEDLKKSLFLTSPALILGLGIIAPLYAGGSLRENALLGILAMVMISLSTTVLAALRPLISKNGRVGIAVLVAGGLLTIAKIAGSAISPGVSLPVETLMPLLLIAAVLASVTDAYEVKNKLSSTLFDGGAIGISFLLLLCFAGLIRDLLGNDTFAGLPVISGLRPYPFRVVALVPGVLLISALIVLLLRKKKRGQA
jgi:Na+-translocating ferredoxin:NAD+ oxidoreductase subunit E